MLFFLKLIDWHTRHRCNVFIPCDMVKFAGNMHGGFSNVELFNRKDTIQIPPASMMASGRLFSSEALESGNASSADGYTCTHLLVFLYAYRRLILGVYLACKSMCCFWCRDSEGNI